MTVRELRSKYIRFFESKGHLHFPSGSLVPYDVTGRLDESLLFNGAGMIQFKPYFRGIAQPDNKRLTTCQKCVRTGDIDIVGDDTHLTFFEMLGNFSFGDYFKAEAIAFSWEFLTSPEWLGLDPKKLTFTIFEDDDDAFAEWSKWFATVGLNPRHRVFRLDEETNYWPAGAFSKGPPGPCGPNSEMFYWVGEGPAPSGEYTREQWIADDAAGNWVEIWNDVFIQYDWQGHLRNPSRPSDGYEKDGMPELPFRSIDTGMGLDRTALVLGGYKSVYDTDVFEPIFAVIDSLAGSAPPTPSSSRNARDEQGARIAARRIIADHIRTAVFCIADGILPSNTGRGYVLRRLIRRAVLKGVRVLDIKKPFFHHVYEGVAESMGDFYTELRERREVIVETLRSEEALFRRTLENGFDKFLEPMRIQAANILAERSGGPIGRSNESSIRSVEDYFHIVPEDRRMVRYAPERAFELYDTFGFPLEVTQELASEFGLTINVDTFEILMKAAQERSRGGQERESAYGGVTGTNEIALADAPEKTTFTGYDRTEGSARIVRVRQSGDRTLVALDETPFYAESGGQVGDTGIIEAAGLILRVVNTTKSQDVFWHEVVAEPATDAPNPTPLPGGEGLLGLSVQGRVDAARRARTIRNHTATHLLQAALRKVLGTHVTQAGSAVGPDGLRFDFTHGKAMSRDEIAEVERIVIAEILGNADVQVHSDLPIAEAKARGAMALFGEKYGNTVRMVQVDEFSKELCGGIHVRTTGQIGLFKIVSESSAASGVRRIEAITGEAAYEFVTEQSQRIAEAANLLKSTPKELIGAIERTLDAVKEERRKRERAESAMAKGSSANNATSTKVGDDTLVTQRFDDIDGKVVAAWVDDLVAKDAHTIALAALVSDGKITFTCKVGKDAKGHAGNLLREVAKITGGGGGGRPDFATAGGKDVTKVDEALAAAPNLV